MDLRWDTSVEAVEFPIRLLCLHCGGEIRLIGFVNEGAERDICAVTLFRFTGEKGAAISSQKIFLTTH